MRKITVGKWKEPIKGEDGQVTDREVTILNALTLLINAKRPEEMPRGLDKFRTFSKIVKAFEKAEATGTLVLEDAEYSFLKKTIENDIPASWGAHPDIAAAIDAFMEAKAE